MLEIERLLTVGASEQDASTGIIKRLATEAATSRQNQIDEFAHRM